MTSEQQGRVAIVTGAGKGLGAAFARALAAAGMRVVVNNRARAGEPSSAEAVCAAIRAAGGEAVAELSDVAEAPQAIVAAALETFGRLDAVVLNAGINGAAAKVGAGSSDIRSVMETNFFAVAALVEAALPHLLESAAGRLVFVSSSAGLHGVRGRSAYAASKGAVNAYAFSLADEVHRTALRVNTVCPYAATAMTGNVPGVDMAKLAPAQAAAMVAYLASPVCDLHGEILVGGGGRVRRARTLEGRGAGMADGLPAILAMGGAREFRGAEAAFADFYASL